MRERGTHDVTTSIVLEGFLRICFSSFEVSTGEQTALVIDGQWIETRELTWY